MYPIWMRLRCTNIVTRFFAVFACAFLSSAARAQQAFFMGLGDLPGGSFESHATDISNDGSVVVGWSVVEGTIQGGVVDAFRWTKATGLVGLGALTTYNAVKTSQDGSTIIGNIGNGIPANQQAFRWTEAGGLQLMAGIARGVNGDGSVVVGQQGASPGVRWTEATSFAPQVLFPGSAYDVSDDGTVILRVKTGGATGDDYLWTQNGATPLLPPAGLTSWVPTSISGDGKVVIGINGTQFSSDERRVLRWTLESGTVELPPTADGAVPFYFIEGNVSHDGSVIVGAARGGLHTNSLGNSMFIWDPIHGSRNLKQLLIEEYGLGPALAGWTIPRGLYFGVSGDGRTIYGDGLNPLGQQEGWIAFLGTPVPVPEPSSLLLAAMALLPLAMGLGRKVPRG